MPLDLERILKNFTQSRVESTHWDECVYAHQGCAIVALVDEVERLRERVEILKTQRDRAREWSDKARARVFTLEAGIAEHREYARRVGDKPGLNDRMLWALLDAEEQTDE